MSEQNNEKETQVSEASTASTEATGAQQTTETTRSQDSAVPAGSVLAEWISSGVENTVARSSRARIVPDRANSVAPWSPPHPDRSQPISTIPATLR